MESGLVRTPRQFMVKRKKEGQADRTTRAFVALQNRKISRKSNVDKKRGIPLLEISSNENEDENCEDKFKTDSKNTKRVDPIKEALKKWQKEKRHRQMQEKKTKKMPFRVSHVSHPVSEYSHTFQNTINPSSKVMQNELKVLTQNNVSATKKAKTSSSERKTGLNEHKALRKSSCRTMKTRSMSRKASSLISNTTSTNSGSIQMEVDDVPTASATCRTRDAVPARVTRSRRANENGNEQNLSRVQSKSSAIPNDFSFHVPAGVESFVFGEDTFHFKPLSPNSAKKFFPTVELPSETEQTCPTQRDKGKMKDGEETTSVEMNGDLGCEEEIKKHELDATYFRNLADSEVERLKSRFANWEGESDREELVPEEVKGMIRTVIGQVQLLVNKKFKQFYGLLDLSEDPTAEKKALVSDLQGFWDMMYIQVEKIDKQFRELEEMRENNWQEKNTQIKTTKKNVKRTAKPKKSSKTSNSKVSENRNKFREMRAQLKAKMQAEKNGSEDAFKIILTPMKNKKADADPSEPQIILTPVRRSTRKSRGCPNIAIPLVNLPNVSVDLFGACKAPETVASNECAVSNVLDDSIFRPRRSTSAATPPSTSDDLMVFSPTTPAKRGNAYTAS